jgi:pyruvate,orthophosphate dikinase
MRPNESKRPKTQRKSKKSNRKARSTKRCYYFSAAKADGSAQMRELLGGKGANLAEMCSIGLPVPPGFTIGTTTCAEYLASNKGLPKELLGEVERMLGRIEKEMGRRFGVGPEPLLLSVRSGAAVSMPGMMDTVLNLGLNDGVTTAWAEQPGFERVAWDAYRRLINMFGTVVMGVPHEAFEKAFDRVKTRYKADTDAAVPAEGMQKLCEAYAKVYRRHVNKPFPQKAHDQLRLAIQAVFSSWNKPSAVSYRRIHGIIHLAGTAVNVQAMVFGNLGDDSGTGVAFTRVPSTGADELYGEFLTNAQGEDIVAGIRTPRPISELGAWNPRVAKELEKVRKTLEKHFRDMQDLEFTVERGRLFILQTRTGKRTGTASMKIAVDMVKQRLIDRATAVSRVTPSDVTQLLLPSFDPKAKRQATKLTRGLAASPGAASGKLAFTAHEAVVRTSHGEKVILVRRETSAEDVDGMHHAVGILTATGGVTSHAAVVARGWGKCCVVGAGELHIDSTRGVVSVDGQLLGHDDVVSIDGFTGEVFAGEVPSQPPTGVSGPASKLLGWADGFARLGVRANADNPEDVAKARGLGATGIGLCRTEHMFFGDRRILAMRDMILAEKTSHRVRALRKLLPYQRKDFVGILEAMKGHTVTIRLLDPPLHEFLPSSPAAIAAVARDLKLPVKMVERRVSALHEANPMLGHRGCRLALTFPEICDMQVRAITEATIACRKKRLDVRPEIMIPLVGTRLEVVTLRDRIREVIRTVKKENGFRGKLNIPVGTMIEIPRAALTADAIAVEAEFFSFGTNDLTQLTFGYSRDDAGSFLPQYVESGILQRDPFESVDRDGVGALVAMATRTAKAARPGLKVGVCGEHGGDPDSIQFFHEAGLDYVSCSPYRVPIARLVAGQAGLS